MRHKKTTNLGFAKVIHGVICESGNRPQNNILTRLQGTPVEFSNYFYMLVKSDSEEVTAEVCARRCTLVPWCLFMAKQMQNCEVWV